MHDVAVLTLTKSYTDWTWNFQCPACGRPNAIEPVDCVNAITCQHCHQTCDATHAEVALADLTPPDRRNDPRPILDRSTLARA